MEQQNQTNDNQDKKPTVYEVAIQLVEGYIRQVNGTLDMPSFKPGVISTSVKNLMGNLFHVATEEGKVELTDNANLLKERIIELATLFPTFVKSVEVAEVILELEAGKVRSVYGLDVVLSMIRSSEDLFPLKAGKIGETKNWFVEKEEEQTVEQRILKLVSWLKTNFPIVLQEMGIDKAPLFWTVADILVQFFESHVDVILCDKTGKMEEKTVDMIRSFVFSNLPVLMVVNETYTKLVKETVSKVVVNEDELSNIEVKEEGESETKDVEVTKDVEREHTPSASE